MANTFQSYRDALEGAGLTLKERILQQADEDPNITVMELKQLADFAYPDAP